MHLNNECTSGFFFSIVALFFFRWEKIPTNVDRALPLKKFQKLLKSHRRKKNPLASAFFFSEIAPFQFTYTLAKFHWKMNFQRSILQHFSFISINIDTMWLTNHEISLPRLTSLSAIECTFMSASDTINAFKVLIFVSIELLNCWTQCWTSQLIFVSIESNCWTQLIQKLSATQLIRIRCIEKFYHGVFHARCDKHLKYKVIWNLRLKSCYSADFHCSLL